MPQRSTGEPVPAHFSAVSNHQLVYFLVKLTTLIHPFTIWSRPLRVARGESDEAGRTILAFQFKVSQAKTWSRVVGRSRQYPPVAISYGLVYLQDEAPIISMYAVNLAITGLSMTVIAEHINPVGKDDTVDTWRKRGRMPVPTATGFIVDLQIVAIYETTTVNGQRLDLLIEARKTKNDPVKQFGVIFSDTPPDRSSYPIPVLWQQEGRSGVGRWTV